MLSNSAAGITTPGVGKLVLRSQIYDGLAYKAVQSEPEAGDFCCATLSKRNVIDDVRHDAAVLLLVPAMRYTIIHNFIPLRSNLGLEIGPVGAQAAAVLILDLHICNPVDLWRESKVERFHTDI